MEHRYSRRKRIKTGVVIFRSDNIFARGRCIDVGLEGMKIHVAQFCQAKRTVEKNSLLELEFHLPLSRNSMPFREPALVVYSSAEEIGLMFIRYNPELHLTLKKSLYGTPFPHESGFNLLRPDREIYSYDLTDSPDELRVGSNS
jgi:hypothetical protein